MKRFILTAVILPLFAITILSPMESAFAHSKTNPNDFSTKKTVTSVCAAILTATTGVAVYTTNTLHRNNNMPVFSIRNSAYRNRKDLHVFLARGLGKRFAAFFDLDIALVESDEIAIVAQSTTDLTIENFAEKWDEPTIRRSIIFSKASTPDLAVGYIALPEFVARFEFRAAGENKVDYKIYDITEDKVLQSGTLIYENRNALPR